MLIDNVTSPKRDTALTSFPDEFLKSPVNFEVYIAASKTDRYRYRKTAHSIDYRMTTRYEINSDLLCQKL